MAVAAAVVGAALMIGGNIKSNLDAAKAEKKNADAYNAQAEYAKLAHARKLELLDRQQKEFSGKQKSMIAASGISFSGSAIDLFADTATQQYYERLAAESEARNEITNYERLADSSQERADAYSNPMTLMFQSGGTALSAYAQSERSAS